MTVQVDRSTRAAWATAILGLVVLTFSVAVSVSVGADPIPLREVWQAVGGRLGIVRTDVPPLESALVVDLRLPRALLAAACGAGLGMCGSALQSLLRNLLADPYLLGVSSGASTGAVSSMVLGVGGALGLSGGAFIGALIAFGAVMAIARVAGGTSATVVLAGIAVCQIFSALTSFIVMVGADANTTRGVLYWLMGSFASSSWADVARTTAVVVVGMIFCLGSAASLDAFAFGDGQAASLGVHVAWTRSMLLVVTALVTATIVASSGAIGFVGLVVPHIVRAMVGPRHRRLLPASALLGAIFLVWADVVARSAFAPVEVPVGVMTSLIGGPFFVVILLRRRRGAR